MAQQFEQLSMRASCLEKEREEKDLLIKQLVRLLCERERERTVLQQELAIERNQLLCEKNLFNLFTVSTLLEVFYLCYLFCEKQSFSYLQKDSELAPLVSVQDQELMLSQIPVFK